MDYQKVLEELQAAGEESYRLFSENLIPGEERIYGVRMPRLRAMAKRLAPDWQEFLRIARDDSHEELMLQGLVIGAARCPLEERLAALAGFVPRIRNWSVCDSTSASLKAVRKETARYFEFLQPYLRTEEEFPRRFAIVSLMDYFITDAFIRTVLADLAETDHPAYYVQMAAAWALSVCFVKYRDITLPYFTEQRIKNAQIRDKAIRKCRESFRVTPEDKELLKSLR